MEKQFKLMAMLLMSVTLCFGIISCHDDKEEVIEEVINNSLIVGNWLDDEDEVLFRFNADGSGYGYELVSRNGKMIAKDYWQISWVYDERKSLLMLTEYFEDEYEDDTFVLEVISVSKNKLVLREKGEDDIITFTRKSESFYQSIEIPSVPEDW